MARKGSNQNNSKPFCNNCKQRHHGSCNKPPFCEKCKTNHHGDCNSKPHCNTCGKNHYGTCNQKDGSNRNKSKSQYGPGTCDYCNKSGHVANDCRQKQNDEGRKKSVGDTSMDGMDVTVLYCGICNNNGHLPATCPHRSQEALEKVMQSPVICWRCRNRGHTADECRATTQPGCVVCRTLTHNIEDCKVATAGHKKLVRHNQRERNGSSLEVFRSNSAFSLFNREADKVMTARRPATVPGIAPSWLYPSLTRRPSVYNNPLARIARLDTSGAKLLKYPQSQALAPSALNMPTPTNLGLDQRAIFQANKAKMLNQRRDQMDLEIDKLIDKAHMNYHKQCVSHFFTDFHLRQALMEQRLFSKERLDQAGKAVMDLELNFFRDPKSLEAIARHMVPECRTCHTAGEICDRQLNPVPVDQNVFTIEDDIPWGIVLAMKCQCCLVNGYDFVPRIEYDEDGRPKVTIGQLTPRSLFSLVKAFSN